MLKTSRDYLDSAFLDRVRCCYRSVFEAQIENSGEVWGPIRKRQAEIHAALLAGSDDDLRNIFADPGSTELYYGVDELYGSNNYASVGFCGIPRLNDDMASLAVALALSGTDPDEVLNELDVAIRQRVEFPNPSPNEFGLITARGIATFRAIQSLYQTWRILELLHTTKRQSVV